MFDDDDAVTWNGDCLDLLPGIPDGSVDLVLCDLPYGTTSHGWDTRINLGALWREYDRVLKPNGACLLFAQCPFDKILAMSNLKNLRYEWVWEKSVATGWQNAKRMPLKATENILVFYRRLPTYNPQGLRDIDPIRRKTVASPHTRMFSSGLLGREYTRTKTGYPRNLLRFARDPKGVHPTQKPVALLEYLIRTYTNPGDVVLDNTMGSGSTLVAARQTGRRSIGIERDESYFALAQERLASTPAFPIS